MKNIYKAFVSQLFLMLLLSSFLTAGNGKISGVVKDSLGKPVPGAKISIPDMKISTISDDDGRYFILNVPPGKYDIVVNAVGYNQKKIISVKVISDLTTEINVSLEPASVEAEEIAINADRNLINKTMASSKTIYSADDLAKTFPTSNTFEILQTSPSIYKGFLRGGLQNQTKFLVDGVDISDSYYTSAGDRTLTTFNSFVPIVRYRESVQAVTLGVNPSSISEMTVNPGTTGAEYYSAAAGIINYTLKEGKGPITGKISIRKAAHKLGIAGPDIYSNKNAYLAERDSLFANKNQYDSSRAKLYTWKDGLYKIGQVPFEGDLSLSGSINDKLGFSFSVNFKNNPDCRLPNQRYKELNSHLKLTYMLTENIKITALGMLCDRGKLFGWKNSDYTEYMKFYLQGVPQNDGASWVGSVKLSHFISSNTFYEVQLSNKNDNNRMGYVDGNNDGKIDLNEEGDFITFSDKATIQKYVSSDYYSKAFGNYLFNGGDVTPETRMIGIGNITGYMLCKPEYFYENFKNSTFTAKIDLTSQISFNHQLKSGVSLKRYDLNMDRRSSCIGWEFYPAELWDFRPIEFGAYVQDKMEYNRLTINLGIRYDLWDPKAAEIKDINNPFQRISEMTQYGLISHLTIVRGENIDPYTYFSPRVSAAYAITDNAAVNFSFSKNFQPPPFSMLYTNYNNFNFITFYPELSNIMDYSTGFSFTKIAREPYKTTNYEIGAQWKILGDLTMNVNAYYTDYKNYFDSSVFISQAYPRYYLHYSAGKVTSKGIEFTLQGAPTAMTDFLTISGRMSYTYSKVKGDKYIIGNSSNLVGGYSRDHRIVYTLFMNFPYDISLNSAGTFQSGFWYLSLTNGKEYKQGPWNKQIDLKLEKAVKIYRFRFTVFADIKNLFDSKNILAYDNSIYSGAKLWDLNGDPTGTTKTVVGDDGSLFYDIPREVYFGISLDF